jgi:hypothetical protein
VCPASRVRRSRLFDHDSLSGAAPTATVTERAAAPGKRGRHAVIKALRVVSDYPLLLDDREDQGDPAGRFRLADADAGDIDVLKDGRPQYRIETRERSLADCVCSRLTPGDRGSISGRMLIQTQGGTRTEHRLDTDNMLPAAYRDHFGIVLSRLPDNPAG